MRLWLSEFDNGPASRSISSGERYRGACIMPVYIFDTFDDPLAFTGTTQALGVNDTDQIVGYYNDATGRHGYLLSGGNYTTLDDPLATGGTQAVGINNTGQIVGEYVTGTARPGLPLRRGTDHPPRAPRATPHTVRT